MRFKRLKLHLFYFFESKTRNRYYVYFMLKSLYVKTHVLLATRIRSFEPAYEILVDVLTTFASRRGSDEPVLQSLRRLYTYFMEVETKSWTSLSTQHARLICDSDKIRTKI